MPQMRSLITAVFLLALGATPAFGSPAPGHAPPDISLDKVLVVGTDGTRWDLLQAAMKSGRAPNLARLGREGFARPSLLEFGPDVLTLSEVGWSSIASGVWPDKHGIDGSKLNMDPGQATKNGYRDFLTRIENNAADLYTYLASDWANIGLAENGGPIFGSMEDARFTIGVDTETLAAWNAGDVEVTEEAERFLRNGDPDASFVYLGLVDETAHLVGSARPAYANAIATTDGRIGRLIRAIRSRPSYPFESWTILVTTDHGQRALSEPSILSHFGQTPLELTSFVIGSGAGLGRKIVKPRIVDIAPTVLHQLGVRVRPSWRLDGRSLSRSRASSWAFAAVRGGPTKRRLVSSLKFGSPPKGVTSAVVHLPAAVSVDGGVKAVNALVNGRPASVRLSGRTVVAKFARRKLRKLAVGTEPGGLRVDSGLLRRRGAVVTVILRSGKRTLGRLRVELAG
jgi:hypothetical protein